jgi:hypothetical protein
MSLSAKDLEILNNINVLFSKLETTAEEQGNTPDEYIGTFKKHHVGGIAYLESDLPVVGIERATIFAKSTAKQKIDEKLKK